MKTQINIAELLKDCPKGMELYSPLCGKCVFDRVNFGTIICKKQNTQEITFTSRGYYMLPVFDDCECMIFPSKDQRDWSKFQRPFKDGDIVVCTNTSCTFTAIFKSMRDDRTFYRYGVMFDNNFRCLVNDWSDFNDSCRLATEEEKQKLFQTIKNNGYNWDAETKTLEKLPKFKVGDKIQSVISSSYYTVVDIKNDQYFIKSDTEKYPYQVSFSNEINYKLVHNKFDINTLVPFESRVLVRDNVDEVWFPCFFGGFVNDDRYPYRVIGGEIWKYCIPYEGNEHLRGTTDDCDEYYKNW